MSNHIQVRDELFDRDTGKRVGYVDLKGEECVSGPGLALTASRTAIAADNAAAFEVANGVTYTLSGAVGLPDGVTLIGPASGSATIAVTGGATVNGGTSPVTISAGQVFAVIPRPTNPTAFLAKGS